MRPCRCGYHAHADRPVDRMMQATMPAPANSSAMATAISQALAHGDASAAAQAVSQAAATGNTGALAQAISLALASGARMHSEHPPGASQFKFTALISQVCSVIWHIQVGHTHQ